MKTLKVKNLLFSLFAVMAIAVFMTSCEQESIGVEDWEGIKPLEIQDNNGTTEDVIEPPLTLEELDAIWNEMEQNEGDIAERSSICACKRVYATRRSNTSSYVYCQRWQDVSSVDVEYKVGSSSPKYKKKYYETFDGLTSGKIYNYTASLWCNNGDEFTSNYYCFIQNSYYPSPHVYY